MLRSLALLLLVPAVAAQTPPPQTTPITRGSGWAEPWQARWQLTPMLEVNLATGNLLCAISTGRFYYEGLPPYHEVALVHNAQRASTSGDFLSRAVASSDVRVGYVERVKGLEPSTFSLGS